jgi:hypothetical protein
MRSMQCNVEFGYQLSIISGLMMEVTVAHNAWSTRTQKSWIPASFDNTSLCPFFCIVIYQDRDRWRALVNSVLNLRAP